MLSQRGRYALKAMIRLARADDGAASTVAAIAAEEHIPRKFLEAIMGDLRRLGLIESRRGKGGGYRLARPAEAVTFGEIVRATDGPLALIACASQTGYQALRRLSRRGGLRAPTGHAHRPHRSFTDS